MTSPSPAIEAVLYSPTHQMCAEYALVLRATDIACHVQQTPAGYALLVDAADAARARSELETYARENRDSVIPQDDDLPRTDGWTAVLVFGAVLLLVAVCNDRDLWGYDWFDAGKTSAVRIREGQWWRTVTALTLHADLAHLLANLVVGGWFGLFAARALGSGLAWFSILVGGAAGNLLNAWLRPASHTSVGASTAIFAALGLIAAWSWIQRRSSPFFSLKRWAPLVGGVVLLGFLGGGGDARTDVGAHVAGFLCGTCLGTVWGRLALPARVGITGQVLLTLAAGALLALAWTTALLTMDTAG